MNLFLSIIMATVLSLLGGAAHGKSSVKGDFNCIAHSNSSAKETTREINISGLRKYYLEDAFKAFSDPPGTKPKERARVFLRTSLLMARDRLEIFCQREFVTQLGATNVFLTFFDEMVDWVSATQELSGEEVYKLSKEIGKPWPKGSVDARTLRRINRLNDSSAKRLWYMAVNKEYPQALREDADIYFDKSNRNYSPCSGAFQLLKLVRQGDSDAALELGQRYLKGDGLAQDDVRAFVWFYVAATMGRGAEIDDINQSIFERFTEKDRREAALWLRHGAFPTCKKQN